MAAVFSMSMVAHSEVEKFAAPTQQGVHLYWWPKTPDVPGWVQDKDASVANSIYALVRKGQTFRDAPVVIYAKAVFKPRVPQIKTLAAFIADDTKGLVEHFPDTIVRSVAPLRNADGRPLVSVHFLPKSEGNWEQVSYLEEGEYFLVFAISARSKAEFEMGHTSYEWLVSHYKERP